MTIMVEDSYRNFTLAEMRSERPGFFSNTEGPERYHIRKNHLIIKRLDTRKITVWQFVWFTKVGYILRPVWYPPEDLSIYKVIWGVEERLADGRWPISESDYGNPYEREEDAHDTTNS